MERIFDIDPLTGITRIFRASEDGEKFTIETRMDVEPIIEQNKGRLTAESSKGRNWRGDMHRVASIPLHIYMDLKQRGILDDQKKLRAWLNDPSNRYFRTKGGIV